MSESAAFRTNASSLDALTVARFEALAGLTPALVLVDVQVDFAAPEAIGFMCETPDDLATVQEVVERQKRMVEVARAHDVPVVWVEIASRYERLTIHNWLRNGSREISLGDRMPCVEGTPGAEWYGGLTPLPGEIRVKKPFYSGFIDTELDARLREAGIGWLVIGGLTTECCVFSTANDAMQHDWPVVVPADLSASYAAHFHEAALSMLALNSSLVTTSEVVVEEFAKYHAGLAGASL